VGPVPRTAMCSSCTGPAGTFVDGGHAVLVYGTMFLSSSGAKSGVWVTVWALGEGEGQRVWRMRSVLKQSGPCAGSAIARK